MCGCSEGFVCSRPQCQQANLNDLAVTAGDMDEPTPEEQAEASRAENALDAGDHRL